MGIAKRTPVSKLKRSVTATHPNINGIAPGNAPIKPEIGVLVFNGVYPTTYIKDDSAPKKAHLKLIIESKKIPIRPNTKEKIKALEYQKYYTGGSIVLMFLVLLIMYFVLN